MFYLIDITGYILLSEVICTLLKGNKHTLKGVEKMKEELRRLTKDGELKFYHGTREENREKALKLLETAQKSGYQGYKVYSNSFGYIVRLEG